jgi:hypothetical protein
MVHRFEALFNLNGMGGIGIAFRIQGGIQNEACTPLTALGITHFAEPSGPSNGDNA